MSKTVVPSIDAIIESFPNKPTKIRGLPNYESLQALKKDLLINASSVPCTLGGGSHGYLGALLTDAANATVTAPNNTPFVAPIFPGNLPAALAGTAAQIADALRSFDETLRQWCEYDNVTKAIRNQIIGAIDATFLSPLKNTYSGYNNVTVRDMLDYLFRQCFLVTRTVTRQCWMTMCWKLLVNGKTNDRVRFPFNDMKDSCPVEVVRSCKSLWQCCFASLCMKETKCSTDV